MSSAERQCKVTTYFMRFQTKQQASERLLERSNAIRKFSSEGCPSSPVFYCLIRAQNFPNWGAKCLNYTTLFLSATP